MISEWRQETFKYLGAFSCGVMPKVLESNVEVSEFEYPRESYEPPYPTPVMT